MCRNNIHDSVRFRGIRQPIQLQQDQAADSETLANDQLAEILIFRNENEILGIRRT
jgi:hypothetical protein